MDKKTSQLVLIGFLTKPEIMLKLKMTMMDCTSTLLTYCLKCSLLIIEMKLNLTNLRKQASAQDCLKESFLLFDDDIKNSLFNSVLHGFLFKLTENNRVSKDNIVNTLGKEFFDKLNESKELLQVDDSLEGLFKKCVLVNGLLEKIYF